MSQSALSRQTQVLENEICGALLERTTAWIRPTDAGYALATSLPRVLADYDAAIDEARRLARGQRDCGLGGGGKHALRDAEEHDCGSDDPDGLPNSGHMAFEDQPKLWIETVRDFDRDALLALWRRQALLEGVPESVIEGLVQRLDKDVRQRTEEAMNQFFRQAGFTQIVKTFCSLIYGAWTGRLQKKD
jgi:hypothetical protein